jgi:hypothetical protein
MPLDLDREVRMVPNQRRQLSERRGCPRTESGFAGIEENLGAQADLNLAFGW